MELKGALKGIKRQREVAITGLIGSYRGAFGVWSR
jgi:hypothetical protein